MATKTGTSGDNILRGTSDSDVLIGRGGDDILYGRSDGDVLRGDDGTDSLFGQGGDDTLIGGRGDDLLSGGSADNRGWWRLRANSWNKNRNRRCEAANGDEAVGRIKAKPDPPDGGHIRRYTPAASALLIKPLRPRRRCFLPLYFSRMLTRVTTVPAASAAVAARTSADETLGISASE